MIERFGIITNCTARKRAVEPVARLKPAQLTGGAALVADRWLCATANTEAATTAGELYVGRAMSESKAVATHLAASLHVVSAGLGLAAQDDPVPNYDMTVATGVGSLAPALAQAGSGTSDWWQELNARKGTPLPLSQLVNRSKSTRFLIALPSAYVAMLERDLAHIQDKSLDRLRIFTSASGAKSVAPRLQSCVLPYDERLEGLKGYAGTRSDFPQRAMRHFVEQIQGHAMDAELAKEAVRQALNLLKKPLIPARVRKTDAEILDLIRTQWCTYAGSSSRLHRYLRDTALVACEQARFGGLWRQVKTEIQ
ncbi:hypothetical protein QTI66_35975 [Variovorax sp. J22R133]|uniref:hypothetical protein n=1 Tax=Variovorax brevis TaxID=3053503 RepID=UPI00257512BA|nr:hypothetical protein [Variovorax sp. J22R133]MDM0117515.1 hypothetical protein [Variovorax sp. J22R133]